MKTPTKIIFIIIASFTLFGLFLAAMVKISNESMQRAEQKIVQDQRENAEAIETRHVVIGMTAAQCRQAWGEPEEINRTSSGRRDHEQWVYHAGRSYLYFDNGVLRSVQQTKRDNSSD